MRNIIYLLFGVLTLSSCSDWLDVQPKTNVEESELFKNEQGFKEALTGVYIGLADDVLYGQNLTYGFLDFLAQRYQVDPNYADFSLPKWYEFEQNSDNTLQYTNPIWNRSYNIIANLNNLIANIDRRGDVITTDGLRDIIKGEAIGLRAFIYFDLLRMWGPIYKDNSEAPSIPYRTVFDRRTAKLLPAVAISDSIIADLKKAEHLLENDAMEMSFPIGTLYTGSNGFLEHRYKRMNKYAVKAELARIYLYIGDKVNAATYAREVIEAHRQGRRKIFSLISDNTTDHLGSTELIFSLSMDSKTFPNQVKENFLISNTSYFYIQSTQRINQLFDIVKDGTNDMRMKEGGGFDISPQGGYTRKYMQNNFSNALNNTVPLIRLPEMYYILAECSDNLQESANYLSTVRVSRGLESISLNDESEKMTAIEKEYRKEFYAEGQLWFFYKRNGYKTFQFCPLKKDLTETNYRFSIPDDEITLGNIN